MDKNTVSLRLSVAAAGDAQQLYSWFTNLDDIQSWGGPSMEYPMSLASFIELLKFDSLASFKLTNSNQQLVAFGQSYLRAGRVHFGRLAVGPDHRGKGLGRRLLTELMQHAPHYVEGEGYSLFVMADNVVAKSLYKSIGFNSAQYPDPLTPGLNKYEYMIADLD